MDCSKLRERVQNKINNVNIKRDVPILEVFETNRILSNRKSNGSSVPGDVPAKLKKVFEVELAEPITDIFNSISKSGEYPRQWVKEFITGIPKVHPPESVDDIRNISITSSLSKAYESLLATWLMPYVQKRIDPGQMGGLKGCSISHYLIILYDFVLSNPDNSVLAALIDFSKEFNRSNHAKIINRLSDWGVPG